ncbi:hypothetical protein JW710_02530 [Candidatus Dojkabacteria bacterium]|nr:hypothetical protein [Candidatus Dojkabacteria bacterium]
MKKKILGKILCAIFILVILSPFGYLLIVREYDTVQIFVPQNFAEDGYELIEVDDNRVEQTFIATENNLVGFDLVVNNCVAPSKDVEIDVRDSKGDVVRHAVLRQSPFVNKCNAMNFRFKEIDNSRGKMYFFTISGQDYCPELKYSVGDSYKDGVLLVDGENYEGDLDFVPVYRAGSIIEYSRIILSRLLNKFDRQ